jgi:hypothetical protein
MKTPTFFLNYNHIGAEEAKALNIPPTIPVQQVTYSGKVDLGRRIDPVLVMGDSSIPFGGTYPRGAGIMPHLSMELGWLVPYTSDKWGAHRQCAWYVRQHANTLPQPRVLIIIMTGYTLHFTDWAVAHLAPLAPGAGATAGTPDKETAKAEPPPKPFRATVKVTKVSGAPDPKETPYKEAYTVSEATVTRLWSKADGVAVGDTVLLVEWVMIERKLIEAVTTLKPGVDRTLDLTRWEKKLNAKQEDTRMILDDTENYDADLYWVSAQASSGKDADPEEERTQGKTSD